jgi:hypothetical protein
MPLEPAVTERQRADAQRMEHLEAYRVDAYTTVTDLISRHKYKACCPLCGKLVKERVDWDECGYWIDDEKTCPRCHGFFTVEADERAGTVTARAEHPLEE